MYYHATSLKISGGGVKSSKGLPTTMPSLMRLLFFVGLFCGLIFVAAAALVAFVEPVPREMSQPVKPELLNK